MGTAWSRFRGANGCDIRDLEQLVGRLQALAPDAVINCASHTGSVHYVMRSALGRRAGRQRADPHECLPCGAVACPAATIVNPISNCTYPGDSAVQREPEWLCGAVHESVAAAGMPAALIYALADCYQKQCGTKSVNWLIANCYGPGDDTDPDHVHALNGIIIRMLQASAPASGNSNIGGPARRSGMVLRRGRGEDPGRFDRNPAAGLPPESRPEAGPI